MKKILSILISLFLIFLLTNCGGGGESTNQTNIDNIPDWYLNPPNDPNYLFGKYFAQSKSMQLALDNATVGARNEIGNQVEIKMQGLQKKFDEEVGVGENSTLLQQFTQATKAVMSTALSGKGL